MRSQDYASKAAAFVYDEFRFRGPGGKLIDRCETDLLKAMVGDRAGAIDTLLEIGVGTARLSVDMMSMPGLRQFVGVDLSPFMLRRAIVNTATLRTGSVEVLFVNSNAYFLPFSDERFDMVMFFHLTKHIDRLSPLMNEVARVAKTTGIVIVEFSNSESLARLRKGSCTLYSVEDVLSAVLEAGLTLTAMTGMHFVGETVYYVLPQRLLPGFSALDRVLSQTLWRYATKVIFKAEKR